MIGQGKPPSAWHGWPADAPHPPATPVHAEQAKKHQAAWAKYLKLEVEYTNSIGMKFVLIPPGEFTMGHARGEIEVRSRWPVHQRGWKEQIHEVKPRSTRSS